MSKKVKIILGVLILAAIAATCYYFFVYKKKKATTQTSVQTPSSKREVSTDSPVSQSVAVIEETASPLVTVKAA